MSDPRRHHHPARQLGLGLLLALLCRPPPASASDHPIAQHPASPIQCNVTAQPNETPADLITRLQPLADECRRHVDYLFITGQALNTLQRYEQAADRLESVLMQQPDHWPAQLEYAIALDGIGDRSSADALLAQLAQEAQLPPALQTIIRQRRARWQQAPTATLQRRQSLALITGHDNNLLGSTRSTQLNLTLPNGTLPVRLDPSAQPRSGRFGRLDWRQDLRLTRPDNSSWNLALAANLRHAPSNSDTDFNLLGLSLERVAPQQQGPFLLFAVQNLNADAGNIYRLTSLTSGLDLAIPPTGCQSRLALDLQYRRYPQVALFNGLYSGLLLQAQCPQSGWHLRLRLGQDHPEYDNRPGGAQTRSALLVGKQTTLGNHRLTLELDLEHQADHAGFSPLLDNNLTRKINKTAYRIEYTMKGQVIQPLLGIEWLNQQSNLALYDIQTRIAYLGLRWTW